MATTSISLSPPDFLSVNFKPKCYLFLRTTKLSLPLAFPTTITSESSIIFHCPLHKIRRRKSSQIWRTYATAEEAPPSEANPLETSQQIVSGSGDDGVSIIISALLFIAFVGLSILTIGVKSTKNWARPFSVRLILWFLESWFCRWIWVFLGSRLSTLAWQISCRKGKRKILRRKKLPPTRRKVEKRRK